MNLKSVELSLNGFISIHNGLILYEKSKILLRSDNDRASKKVKLISGGGAGHEPAHSGFIGHGMLTAIVSGDIFASPAVAAILNSILLTGDKNSNIILIVTNYTGDRLNFAFAAELAKVKYGYENIKTILVNDDCSIDNCKVRKSVGKRGLCGTVLIHKIAGAMAEKKYKIDEICYLCNQLLQDEKLFTIGVSFSMKDNQLTNIEIGKGIHGEPGIQFIEYNPDFDEIIEKMISKFLNRSIEKGSSICLLVNNLGGTSQHMMSLFSGILIEKLKNEFLLEKILQGSFQTSLNQEGITVTILSLEKNQQLLLDCLNFETSVPCSEFGCNKSSNLKKSVTGTELELNFEENGLNGFSLDEKGVECAKTILTFICEYLISAESKLNKIDEEFGDGDTGSTLKKGADSILSSLNENQIDLIHPARILQKISEIFQFSVGGTSGVLYGIFFQTSSQSFLGTKKLTMETWLDALKYGNESLMKYGLAEIGDRTMLDSLKGGEIALKKCIQEKLNVLSCVEGFAKGCEDAAKNTINMFPKSGRAAYTFSENNERKCEFPDPGAHAVEIWSQALFQGFKFVLNSEV